MDNTEFSTPFSTNFFTDFSNEFSGFKPIEFTMTEDVKISEFQKSESDHNLDKSESDHNLNNTNNIDDEQLQKEIIEKHKTKYKEYIDEYIAQKNSATIECDLSISRFSRVDRAYELLHMPISPQTERFANEIGCVIKNRTLYPVNWTKEEIDELNRRMTA